MLSNWSLVLLMMGSPMGMGMAPELHPHVCIKGQKFWPKATSLVLAGRSGMDKKPPLDSFLLPSLCGTVDFSSQCTSKAKVGKGFYRPLKAEFQKSKHTTLISVKTKGVTQVRSPQSSYWPRGQYTKSLFNVDLHN